MAEEIKTSPRGSVAKKVSLSPPDEENEAKSRSLSIENLMAETSQAGTINENIEVDGTREAGSVNEMDPLLQVGDQEFDDMNIETPSQADAAAVNQDDGITSQENLAATLRAATPSLQSSVESMRRCVEICEREYAIKGKKLNTLQEYLPTDVNFDDLPILERQLKSAQDEPEETFHVKGRDLHALAKQMSQSNLNRLIAQQDKLGKVLREVTKPCIEDEDCTELTKAQKKVEDITRRVNEVKGYLQMYLCKDCKRPEDCKKIQKLRCELERAMTCQKTAVEELMRLQRTVKRHCVKPIILSTTLAEDNVPNLYGLQGSSCRAFKPKKAEMGTTESNYSLRIRQAFAEDNIALSNDRCELQKTLLEKERTIDCLHEKLRIFECQLNKSTHDKQKLCSKINCMEKKPDEPCVKARLEAYKKNADCLEQNIEHMTLALDKLKNDLHGVEQDRDSCKDVQSRRPCSSSALKSRRATTIEDENLDLKKQYKHLVQEFNRKENEIKHLKDCLSKKEDNFDCKSPGDVELEMMKKQYYEILDEQEEYNIIIKEQTRQIEDYRNKYMDAQQTAEELRRQMNGMEMNNEKIQEQVNVEIHRIKCKFQEKMKELTPFPKMLENEQLKVHELLKTNKALEAKLMENLEMQNLAESRVKELESLYNQNNPVILGNLRDQIDQLEDTIDQLKLENARYEQKYADEKDRYDALRSETAKIIARSNERSEATRFVQLERINQLEKELAKNRADASVDLAMREETIRKVEGRMKILSSNFDDAQGQIKQLRNHIVFLTKPDKQPTGSWSSQSQNFCD